MTAPDRPLDTDPTAGTPDGRRSARRRFLAVAATAAVLLVGTACASGPASAPATTSPAGAAAQHAEIVITNFMFLPAAQTVHPGQTVTVVNRDQVAHTVTSASGGFNIGDVQPGQSVTFTAPDHAGTFHCICSIHQYMSGTLTVS